MDLNRFTQKAQEAVIGAQEVVRNYGHQTIEPAHLLLALLNQTDSTFPVIRPPGTTRYVVPAADTLPVVPKTNAHIDPSKIRPKILLPTLCFSMVLSFVSFKLTF